MKRYRITKDVEQLIWRSWSDDHFLVYHPRSGNTHLLNQATCLILDQLRLGHADAQQLAGSLAEATDLNIDQTLHRHVQQMLEQLDQVGLIDPMDDPPHA